MKDGVGLGRKVSVRNGLGLILSAIVLTAAPVAAQDNNAASVPATNSSAIGPGELSNFNLNGTVTRPADRPPATQPAAPAPTGPSAAQPSATREVPVAPAVRSSAAAERPAVDNDLFRRPPTLPSAGDTTVAATAAPDVADTVATSPPPLPESGFSPLPWLAALLAIAGAAFLYFGWQRRQRVHAAPGHPPIDITRQPAPAPPPAASPRKSAEPAPRADPPAAPAGARRPLPTTLLPQAPQPRPDPLVPGAIVSTGLRPWIDVELIPDRALLDEQGAAIAFEVTLFNSGSAAARDVIIEARLLNAGARQDEEVSAFFTTESRVGDPIPQIAPFARIPMRSAVRLPREAISEYEFEGRKLFMPLVAVSVRYRWSSGEGQSAAGFLVGQGETAEKKLAPLRLDRGARSWKGLGARRYEKGLRT